MNAKIPAEALAPFGDDYGPLLTGPFAPVFDELDIDQLELIKGKVPADLNGIYLRAGPNARFEPNGRYHPFDGDGMVHAATFAKGKVSYRNRWVRTDGWLEEHQQQHATHFGIRETLKGREDKRLKDTANTDLVGHAGKALALWYMSGDAYEIDPATLQTLGKSQAICASGGKISAHAKVDEVTEEMMFFDYGHEAPFMHYGVVGPKGELKHYIPIDLPGARLPHDMAITEHYSIIHDLPLFHDPEAMKLGRHKIRFYPELPFRIGVIPRLGSANELRWFNFSPCYLYHTVNAWEDGDSIVMIGCRYMPRLHKDGTIDPEGTAKDVAELVMRARLWRWEMNLKTGATSERVLDTQRNVEFPTCNGRLTGRKTQFGYLVNHADAILQWNGIRKYDLNTGAMLSSWTDNEASSWYSEPWFAQADTALSEDHGYVIAFQWDHDVKRQTLDIFDARDLNLGPIAQLAMPCRLPTGFHACWIAQDRIKA
jgi:carotenoid cleavage dioxygenase-like enzyme